MNKDEEPWPRPLTHQKQPLLIENPHEVTQLYGIRCEIVGLAEAGGWHHISGPFTGPPPEVGEPAVAPFDTLADGGSHHVTLVISAAVIIIQR